MIVLAVTYLIATGHEEEAAAHFLALAEQTRREPGNRLYLVHRSTQEPRRFFLYEQYDDQAALDEHRASPHFETHARAGIMQIMESRSPETYELLT
ncbi:MAG TPA: putative quinol monooxygenase [Candidatus Baltobacteraceae bacterium]|jgi:quinol monooxygenase YgiN